MYSSAQPSRNKTGYWIFGIYDIRHITFISNFLESGATYKKIITGSATRRRPGNFVPRRFVSTAVIGPRVAVIIFIQKLQRFLRRLIVRVRDLCVNICMIYYARSCVPLCSRGNIDNFGSRLPVVVDYDCGYILKAGRNSRRWLPAVQTKNKKIIIILLCRIALSVVDRRIYLR